MGSLDFHGKKNPGTISNFCCCSRMGSLEEDSGWTEDLWQVPAYSVFVRTECVHCLCSFLVRPGRSFIDGQGCHSWLSCGGSYFYFLRLLGHLSCFPQGHDVVLGSAHIQVPIFCSEGEISSSGPTSSGCLHSSSSFLIIPVSVRLLPFYPLIHCPCPFCGPLFQMGHLPTVVLVHDFPLPSPPKQFRNPPSLAHPTSLLPACSLPMSCLV